MRKIYALFLFAALFTACSMPSNDLDNSGGLTPPGNGIQVDPAYWFGGIYRALVAREQDGTMGQIANVQYVIDMINRRWGAGTLTPFPGTEMQIANTEYLLKVIDMANGGRTNFGESSFATKQIVDVIAVNDAVNRLFMPGDGFVIVGGGGTGIIAHSDDGINWTASNAASTSNLRGVAYGNGRWIALGDTIHHSINRINWTATAVHGSWRSAAFGNGGFVAVRLNAIATSTDGINWTTTALNGAWQGVAFGNGRFVAVSLHAIATSTYGINWTTTALNGPWQGVAFGGS